VSPIVSVVKRSGAVVPFTPERITNAIYRAAVAVGGRDRATAERLTTEVVRLLEMDIPPGQAPTIEEIQDRVEKVLIENGHAKVAKAYILYREERARARRQRAELVAHPSTNIPWAKIWQVLDWAVTHGVNTVQGLNERLAKGELAEIVRAAEQAYDEDVENAAEMVSARRAELKMVIVSGPSSSGKTTTPITLGQRLERMGLKLVTLNVDNYFYDLELHPKDEFGDYDFETPQALDLAMINAHLKRLVAGETVSIPFYDFKTGHRIPDRTPMRLGLDEVLLIDSLHGLYPPMTQDIPDEQKFRLYLEPLMQMKGEDGEYIRWTDLRLIRRMLRDAVHRAYNPQRTLEHWHYVRSSEKRNILPNANRADYVVNSAMPHELGLYRARMIDQFRTWVETYRDDPLREDAFTRARRIAALLQTVTPVTDEGLIPPDSVLREFIGSSCYDY